MGLIAKNMAALLASQVATWVMALFMLIVIPQQLGDRQFGQLSVAGSLVAFFGLFATVGAGPFIVKQVARDPSRVGPYVFNALLMSLVLAVLLSGAAIGTAIVLGYPAETCIIVAVACGGMVLGTLNTAFAVGLQGQQRMRRPAAWAVVDRYVAGIAVVAALATGHGLLGVAMASSWTGWASLLGNGAQLFRQVRSGARLDLRLWRILAFGGMPFVLWSLVLMIYGSIDVVILSKMVGDAVVGWYAFAYRLVGIPVFLATIVVTASFPQLSAYAAIASPAFAALTNRGVRLVFFAGAPMAAGIALIAGDVITFLHYPSAFAHAVPLIRILALHIPVVGVTTVLGAALMACDRQKRWVIVGAIAAVFNPLLNWIAIPATSSAFGNGAVGASVITVATEFLMLSGALYLLRSRGVPDYQTLSYLARCAGACAMMACVVVLCRDLWLPGRILIGAIAYGLASAIVGTLPIAELQRRLHHILALVHTRSAPSMP